MQWIFWVIAIIVSAGAGYWVYRADKQRAVPYPFVTSLLRGLVVFFTLLLILVPTITITKHIIEKPVVLLLQDNSRSIADALGADSSTYRKNFTSLADKLSAQYKVVQWGFGNRVQKDSLFHYHQPATDISAVLARAQEYFGMQNLGAVVIATDGRYNEGMNPSFQQLSLHSPVYTVGIGDTARQKDIRLTRVYANKVAALNSSFEIRSDMVAELCKGYNNSVTVKEGAETLSSVPVAISNDKSDRSVSFTIKAVKAGLHHYVITVPEAEGEVNMANNRKDIFVEVVDEKKKVLILSAAPHPDINAIKEALSGVETYKVTIAGADNMPSSLSGYDVIVAHSLPSVRSRIAAQLLAAKKPIWFIIGSQTDLTALNTLDQMTHTTLTPSGPRDVVAMYNAAFNTFILPQNIQAVADKMPPLSVRVGNIVPSPGANVLFMQKAQAANAQFPMWVLQQGITPAAILLGEGIWRWRLYEYKNFGNHEVVDECIRQTIAFLAANNAEKPFSVVLPKHVWSDQENISFNAYLRNPNNEQINTPDAQITIIDSAGRKRDFSFERSGSAYNLNIGIWAGGTYTWSAKTTYNDRTYTAAGSFVVESMPLELMETGADYPLLFALARKYNGGFVPAKNISSLYDSVIHNEHVKPLIQTSTETVPLVDRKWYFFIILALAAGEWLLRKYWLAM